MTASIVYQGYLRCKATHVQSGTIIETDAPTDNNGKGEKFSPTDLLCVSLATCICTTIALKANDLQVDLSNTTLEVTKHMLNDPRRIAQIDITMKFDLPIPDDKTISILERTGNNCPVARSIHPDICLNITYNWKTLVNE